MSPTSTLKTKLLQPLRDPEVRTALYLWVMVAGLCAFIANALAR